MSQNLEAAALYTSIQALIAIPGELQRLREKVTALTTEVLTLRKAMPLTLVTVAEAARRLGVSQKTVKRHIEKGLLRGVRVGDRVRIDLGSLPDALEQNTAAAR